MNLLPTSEAPRNVLDASEGLAPVASATATVERGRYEFLDAVRGLAALLVAVQHGAEVLSLPPGRPGFPLNFGEVGVVAFFLVSGFIIPRSLERHGSLRVFWIGRAFRLYPAYWLSLLGALALIASTRLYSPFTLMRHPALGVAINVTMLQSFVGIPNAIGVYWTLGLELVFYLLCSAAFVTGMLRRSAVCLWGAMGLYFAVLSGAALLHRSLPAGMLGLLVTACFGTLALRALSDSAARGSLLRAALPLAAVLALGLYLRFGLFPVAHQVAAPPWTTVVCSWIAGYALFFSLFALRHRRFPGTVLWLGRISYSFYLWHVLVFLSMPVLASRGGTLVLDLLVTALLAEISFRLAERPFLALQRRLFPLPLR